MNSHRILRDSAESHVGVRGIPRHELLYVGFRGMDSHVGFHGLSRYPMGLPTGARPRTHYFNSVGPHLAYPLLLLQRGFSPSIGKNRHSSTIVQVEYINSLRGLRTAVLLVLLLFIVKTSLFVVLFVYTRTRTWYVTVRVRRTAMIRARTAVCCTCGIIGFTYCCSM